MSSLTNPQNAPQNLSGASVPAIPGSLKSLEMATPEASRTADAVASGFQANRVYRIGELAEISQATTRTLRYYEELGLLQPIRNTSGQRLYGEAAVQRLKFINELKSGGFSLSEIKTFFESWNETDTGAAAAEATIEIIQQKLGEIATLQKQLTKLNDELRAMINFLMVCRNCDQKPAVENCSPCDRHEEPTPEMLLNILKTGGPKI